MASLVTVWVRTLESLFAVGAFGSVIVFILCGIEDLEILFGSGNSEESSET